MPRSVQITQCIEFEGHVIHRLGVDGRAMFLAHELAAALTEHDLGATLVEDIKGAWTAAGEMTDPTDYWLASPQRFVRLGLWPAARADEPVLLLTFLYGVEKVSLNLYDEDTGIAVDGTQAMRLFEAIGLFDYGDGDWELATCDHCPFKVVRRAYRYGYGGYGYGGYGYGYGGYGEVL